jgi:serine phosphatase RsbU (regulator of sigma subunit)
MNTVASIYILSIGFATAVALIHLLLYLFYPRERANLFFSLFAFGVAVRFFSSDVLRASDYGGNTALIISLIKDYSVAVASFSYILFLYAAFSRPVAVQFWVVLAAWMLLAIVQTINPYLAGLALNTVLMPVFVVIESLRLIIQALIKRQEGAWLIGLGVILLALAPLKDALSNLGQLSLPPFVNTFVNQLAICSIIVVNSVFLARNFARTNKHLEAKLLEVETLSAERLEQERAATELKLQHEQEKSRRELMERELTLAADIQKGLFPETLPSINGYEIAAGNRPARQCGGDYYDVTAVDGHHAGHQSYLLCVADVAGKGLDAALLMSNMQATLHALAGRIESLVELAAQINQRLYESSPANKFVTAILLEVDPMTGECRYVNAGHNECVLLRSATGEIELLESTGLPLGIMDSDMLRNLGKNYEAKSFRLDAGDLLALYSDGVPEAYDEQEQEWSEARLQECLRVMINEPAQAVVDRVFMELDNFAGTAPQHDDITLLVFKRAVGAIDRKPVEAEIAAQDEAVRLLPA